MKFDKILTPVCSCLLVTSVLTGCKSPNGPDASRPMHSSLDTMTRESSPWYVNYRDVPRHRSIFGWLAHGLAEPFGGDECRNIAWHQSSVISIAGQLPFPEVGHAYYWVSGSSPIHSIPVVTTEESYCWQGTIEPVDSGALTNVRNALDEFQRLSLEVAMEASAKLAYAEGKGSDPTNSSKQLTASASDEAARKAESLRTQLLTARSNLLHSVNQRGIVVARWATTVDSKVSVKSADDASISGGSQETRSGFAILNGMRIRVLHPGSNFRSYYTNVTNSIGMKNPLNVGVVTYLLQAKDIAYAQDYEHLTALSARLDLSKVITKLNKKGTNPGLASALLNLELALEAYRSTVTQLGNYGYLGRIQWTKDNQVNWEQLNKDAQAGEAKMSNDWLSVYAVFTEPKALVK